MFTHLEQNSTVVLHPSAKPLGNRDTIATVMKRGIDLHVHSPRTSLHAGCPPHRAPNPSVKPSGHLDTIATVMKREIDLHVHSPRTNLHGGSPQHSRSAKSSGNRDTIATVMKRGIDLHVHSPRSSLHAGSPPHRAHNPSVKAIRTSGHNSYSNEKRNRFACSLTHLEQIPLVVLHSTAGQQSHQEIGTQ